MKTKYVVETPSGNWFETSLRRAVDTCIAEADVEGKKNFKGTAKELFRYIQEPGRGFDNYQILDIETWLSMIIYGGAPTDMTQPWTNKDIIENLGGSSDE